MVRAFINRMKEPSSHAALAGVIALLAPSLGAEAAPIAAAIGGIAGLLGVILPEGY